MKGIRFSSLLLITLLFSVTAYATDISYVSGPGSLDGYYTATSPWTINETFTGTSTLVLKFTETGGGAALGPGNDATGNFHIYGKWIQKTVFNNTGVSWNSFEIEVQSVEGVPSPDGDGISFAQGGGLTFLSSAFSTYTRIDTTKDYLNFHGGTVENGQTVTFLFAITDNQSHNSFWLAETPNKQETPEPATLLLFSIGFAGIGLAAWRRKK